MFCQISFRNFLKRQHRIKLLIKARQVEEELKEDRKILEELKSFARKIYEDEQHIAAEARTKQLEWLDGVGIRFTNSDIKSNV